MKWIRAALIALIIFIIVLSFSSYIDHRTAQKQRQELLTSFTSELQGYDDLHKLNLSTLNEQGVNSTP